MRKINELVEKGFLKKIIKTNRNGMAETYMYIAVSKKYEELDPFSEENYKNIYDLSDYSF